MQALFADMPYNFDMAKTMSRLRELREAAGISQRELARILQQDSSNISYWERSGKIPRADLLVPMAKALGVTVPDLLGQAARDRASTPGGKLGSAFQQALRLPRRQQEKLAEFIRLFIAQHSGDNAKSTQHANGH
jgi:transcriptional regulator with XRE-family HTH domain